MSSAVSTESTTPAGGIAVTGSSFQPAVSTAGGSGRRISAESFKLLTARLKKAPAAARPDPVIPDIVPEQAAPVPASVPDPDQAEAPVEIRLAPERPASESVAIPETNAPQAVGLADPPYGHVEFGEALKAAPALELPAFQPLEWREDDWLPHSDPEQPAEDSITIENETLGASAAHEAAVEAVELPVFQPVEPVRAAELDLLPSELEANDIAEPVQNAEAVAADVCEAAAEPEWPPIAEPVIVEPVTEAIESQPEPVEAQSSEEFAAPAEERSAAPELIGLEIDVDAEQVEDAEPIESNVSAHVLNADTPSPVENLEAEPVAESAEPLPVPEATAAALPAPSVEAPATPEKKTQTSEMASRVVEAMMKTISNAVYSKPSPSERAAFLREMAALMHEAAEADDKKEGASAAILALHPQPEPSPAVSQPAKVDINVAEALAERIGPTASPLLKSVREEVADPFATLVVPARRAESKPVETADADEESGELALTLLDMMSGGTGSLPHERTLAADTLLRILPRIPVKQLLSVVERVAIMETPPALLVAKLIRDTRAEIVAPLLERCSHISDQDLMNAAPDGDAPKLRMIARRRVLSTVLSDYLIATADPGVLLTLIRNPGAALSHEAFFKLAEHAEHHHGLLAPLTTRADLPPPVAFELFWHVPTELRRFIFSRFLTDSETLNKILRITLSTHDREGEAAGDPKFPPREAIEAAVGQAAAFRIEEAAQAFADMGGIIKATTFRILSDMDGEPVTVLLKALGCTRARFEESLTRLRLSEAGVLRQDRNPEELQAIFDGLSFNKARILLTYWDWFMRKAGPYAPHN